MINNESNISNDLYKDYGLIVNLSIDWYRRGKYTHWEPSDAVAEGYLIASDCLLKYDPSRGEFGAMLSFTIPKKLTTRYRKFIGGRVLTIDGKREHVGEFHPDGTTGYSSMVDFHKNREYDPNHEYFSVDGGYGTDLWYAQAVIRQLKEIYPEEEINMVLDVRHNRDMYVKDLPEKYGKSYEECRKIYKKMNKAITDQLVGYERKNVLKGKVNNADR